MTNFARLVFSIRILLLICDRDSIQFLVANSVPEGPGNDMALMILIWSLING